VLFTIKIGLEIGSVNSGPSPLPHGKMETGNDHIHSYSLCNQCNQRKQNSAYYSGRETRSSNFIRSPSDSTLMKPRPVKQHNFC